LAVEAGEIRSGNSVVVVARAHGQIDYENADTVFRFGEPAAYAANAGHIARQVMSFTGSG
jgi:hypothetical protein